MMKGNNIKKYVILTSIIYAAVPTTLLSTTLVYNMKLSRIFFRHRNHGGDLALTAAPIIYMRDRTVNLFQDSFFDKRFTVGSLLDILYVRKDTWWLEATTAILTEYAGARGTVNFTEQRTGCDDIIISGGYDILALPAQCTVYGLVGMPTKYDIHDFELHDTLVGTRFFSCGIGAEFAYYLKHTLDHTFKLISQDRIIHFFSRGWHPVLPEQSKLHPGNVIDLLFATQYRYKIDKFELGYDMTFFNNQAITTGKEKIEHSDALRHSFYLSYDHTLKQAPTKKTSTTLGTGFLISREKRFKTKIMAAWVHATILF